MLEKIIGEKAFVEEFQMRCRLSLTS